MVCQIVSGGSNNDLHTSATEYNSVFNCSPNGWNGTLGNREQRVSVDCVIHSMLMFLENDPGSVLENFDFDLMVNGSPSALGVLIPGGSTTGSDYANKVSLNAGDKIAIRSSPGNTPTVGYANWSFIIDSHVDSNNSRQLFKSHAVISGSTTNMSGGTPLVIESGIMQGGGPWDSGIANSGDIQAGMLVPKACTVRNFYMGLSNAPGSGESRTFAVQKNGSDTAVTLTISDLVTSGQDTSNTVDFAANDEIRFSHNFTSGTPTNTDGEWGVEIEWDGNAHMHFCNSSDDLATTGTEYNYWMASGSNSWHGTETERRSCGHLMYINELHVKLGNRASSTGGSVTFDLMIDGVASAVSVTISGSNNSGSYTGAPVLVKPFEQLSLRKTTSGTLNSLLEVMWTWVIDPHVDSILETGHGML